MIDYKLKTYFRKFNSKNKFYMFIASSLALHLVVLTLFSYFQGNQSKRANLISNTEILEITVLDKSNLEEKNKSLQSTKSKNSALVNNMAPSSSKPDINPQTNKSSKIKKQKLNFTGKTSAEIFEYKQKNQYTNIGYADSLNKNSYFEDNAFTPDETNYDPYADSGSYEYLDKGGIAKVFENNKFYEEVWKRVRHWTGFPKDFLNFRLEGQVRIHATLNNKGELIGDFTHISSENPLLEIYSMAVLSIALSKPINSSFWVKDTQIPVVFEFNYDFVYTEFEEVLHKDNRGNYKGNIFTLTSKRYVMPEVIQKIQNFYYDFFPPVMILPGGMVMIDPLLLYEKYTFWKKNGFQRKETVQAKAYKNLRKEILNALKNPKEHFLNVLNQNGFDPRHSNSSPNNQILRSIIDAQTTDPMNIQ